MIRSFLRSSNWRRAIIRLGHGHDDSISPPYSWSESVCRIACRNYGINPPESKLEEEQSPKIWCLQSGEDFNREMSNSIKYHRCERDLQFQELQAYLDEIMSLIHQAYKLTPLAFKLRSKLPEFRSKVVPDVKSQDPDNITRELNELRCIVDSFEKFDDDDVLAEIDELISRTSQANELIPLVSEFRSKVREFRSKVRKFSSKVVVPDYKPEDLDDDNTFEFNQLRWVVKVSEYQLDDCLADADELITDVFDDLIYEVYDYLQLDGFSLTIRSCLLIKALITRQELLYKGKWRYMETETYAIED